VSQTQSVSLDWEQQQLLAKVHRGSIGTISQRKVMIQGLGGFPQSTTAQDRTKVSIRVWCFVKRDVQVGGAMIGQAQEGKPLSLGLTLDVPRWALLDNHFLLANQSEEFVRGLFPNQSRTHVANSPHLVFRRSRLEVALQAMAK
jgi:hypothetical protein